MGDVYLIPAWFLGFDTAMEVIFSLITLIVALVAFRIYLISQERSIRHVSVGFLLIGLSYLLWAFMHFMLVRSLSADISIINLENLSLYWNLGFYAYMVLFISGLITLAYAATGSKQGNVYYLLLGLAILVVCSAYQKILTFRIVSRFLLSFIA